jgi:Ca2+-binding RTX toxin-like protein
VANAVGGGDTLSGGGVLSTTLIGDAFNLGNRAQGGDDVITAAAQLGAAEAYGDGLTMTGHARGGADAIEVSGRSTLAYGDARTLAGHAEGGADSILVAAGGLGSESYGDAALMTDHAAGGNDHLQANTGAQFTRLVGDAGTMDGFARGGDDTLTTTEAPRAVVPYLADLYGDALFLRENARGGDDLLQGTTAFDSTLYGDGLELQDHAVGGDDTLTGGAGSDVMWGDAAVVGPQARTGTDLFVVTVGGHDQIMDFEPAKDRIELAGFGVDSFDAVLGRLQTTADGVLVSIDAADDLLIRGVTASQLGPGDFLFA